MDELKNCCRIILCLALLFSCQLKKARIPERQEVSVYAESFGEFDTELFKKFEKEEHIHVRPVKLSRASLLNTLKKEKYQSMADLVLFDSYEMIHEAKKAGLLISCTSDKLLSNIDPVYRSVKNRWFALSKTPIVFVYHKGFMKKDTIQNYYQLIEPEWKDQLSFQRLDSKTLKTFNYTIRLLLRTKSVEFLKKLYGQTKLTIEGDDELQIERIVNGEAKLALVKLSSLAKYYEEEKKHSANILPIFPNQRKKGAFYSISGAGIFRYTGNFHNAKKLLEFLASKKAQYLFAKGRYEIPVLKGVETCYQVERFGKCRGRFYHKRFKNKKRP